MEGQLLDKQCPLEMVNNGAVEHINNLFGATEKCRTNWYCSKAEIKDNSPSRKDGINLRKENQLRMLYCSFLQDVGVRLKVPQLTISTAVMFCHRFYLFQSHAKNEWQTVATSCIFLASKVEETPCRLDKVVIVAYEEMYGRDPAACQRIRSKEIFEKQKELILKGERMLLSTVAFDLNIQHPYKPLLAALKKLRIVHKDVVKGAWDFVNDWIRTTLCLQYKPHYIAAGSLYLAANLNNVKLPSERELIWWHQFDVAPHLLEEAIKEMMVSLGPYQRVMAPCARGKANLTPCAAKKEEASSPESCVLSMAGSSGSPPSNDFGEEAGGDSFVKVVGIKPFCGNDTSCGKVHLKSQAQDTEGRKNISGAGSRHGDVKKKTQMVPTIVSVNNDSVSEGLCKVDNDRTRATLKKRKWEREINKAVEIKDSCEGSSMKSELETGLEMTDELSQKKGRLEVTNL